MSYNQTDFGETECQTGSRKADGAPITGFVPEDVAALVTLAQKSATASDWHRNSALLQHVSFDEVIFMEDPVTAAGNDETARPCRVFADDAIPHPREDDGCGLAEAGGDVDEA